MESLEKLKRREIKYYFLEDNNRLITDFQNVVQLNLLCNKVP